MQGTTPAFPGSKNAHNVILLRFATCPNRLPLLERGLRLGVPLLERGLGLWGFGLREDTLLERELNLLLLGSGYHLLP
jgi:hypothetical protein